MFNKPNVLVIVLFVVSILFSGANTYLILNNQSTQQKWNDDASSSLTDLGAKLDKTNTDLATLDQATKSNIDSKYNDLKTRITTTNTNLNQVESTLQSNVDSLSDNFDTHTSLTASNIYRDTYKSVVLVWNSDGQGSGFLFDDNRHIVTNWHLVKTGTDLEVEYYDGTRCSATIVGTDPYSDLAVLLPTNMPSDVTPLRLGNSSTCSIGESVVAVGNPLGTSGSLSSGYISQVNVEITMTDIPLVINEIQLDLTIAPGSSGGALINFNKEVLGVTNGVLGGYSYAVPSNIVKRVTDSIISKGTYQHPLFGWGLFELNKDNIDFNNIFNVDTSQRGLMVTDLVADLPAQKAGILASVYKLDPNGRWGNEAKDIVLAVNGVTVRTFDDYVQYTEEHVSPGDEVDFTIWRSGSITHVTIAPTFRPQYVP
jgi:S1-C subfamily serine protease